MNIKTDKVVYICVDVDNKPYTLVYQRLANTQIIIQNKKKVPTLEPLCNILF